jgi:hypothetical protein
MKEPSMIIGVPGPRLVDRYPHDNYIASDLEPFDDLRGWLAFVLSGAYFQEIACNAHGLTIAEAKRRFKRVRPHLCAALEYVDQALNGPDRLAFLPIYYAILNLMKVYVLLGPYANDLSTRERHGVHYQIEKPARSIFTERITIWPKGVMPLFYRTLTANTLSTQVELEMSEVYPYLQPVGAEYGMATGKPCRIAAMRVSVGIKGSDAIPEVRIECPPKSNVPFILRGFSVLQSFKRVRAKPGTFVGTPIPLAADLDTDIRKQFNTALIYSTHRRELSFVPYGLHQLLMPEELPISLMFFHMSSVVRYKPEFLDKLQESRYWPILIAARRHCFYRFLVLTWSFLHQKNLVLGHGFQYT